LSSYRVSPAFAWVQVALVVSFAVVAPLYVGGIDPGALLFGAACLPAIGYVAYFRLFRDAYLLELSATELRWSAPLRQGTVPLSELREVRPGTPWYPVPMLLAGVVTFTTRSGRTVVADVRARGFEAFAEDLRRAAPEARIHVGRALFRQDVDGYRRHVPP